jgi:mono/diheme cytochrome c family protein
MRKLLIVMIAVMSPAWAHAGPAAVPYLAQCQACHQAGGEGLPGQFPRLRGRVSKIAQSPNGRQYLISVLLTGLAGRIRVDDADIVGVMPAFDSLSDADLAAALTYASKLGAKPFAPPFRPGEIAAVRAGNPAPETVAATRRKLVADKTIP